MKRKSKTQRSAVVAAAFVSVFSLALSFASPTQANAVTYSQLLSARSKAAASRQRVSNLKSQLSGVSASLQKQILELDDLTNNQIPAAQESVNTANDAAADAKDEAQAAADRLAAAQKDKTDLQEKIKQTGKDYDDAHAAVAEVARSSMHGSQASDTMSMVVGSKDASDFVDSMQSSSAVSRSEAQSANSSAEELSTSKNREQRLAAIEQQISDLKSSADAKSAAAQSAAADAEAKSEKLESLRDEGAKQRSALKSQESSLKTSAAKEAADSLVIQSQVDSYNKQWTKQQAAAAAKAAKLAAEQQGRLRASSSSRRSSGTSSSTRRSTSSHSSSSSRRSSSSSSSSSSRTSAGRVGHPTGDVGNAYPFSQCTWWAYIRRHRLGLPVGSYFGNGGQWWSSAMRLGYKVDHTPAVGAIVSYLPGQNGSNAVYGHVAIVERVNSNGTILTSNCGAVMQGAIYYQTVSNVHAYWYIHN
jgi:surface antigen/peptidoglycan hydrolase CwlO-like protein